MTTNSIKSITKQYEYSRELFFGLKERALSKGFRLVKQWQILHSKHNPKNHYYQAVSVVYCNREYAVTIHFYQWDGNINEKKAFSVEHIYE